MEKLSLKEAMKWRYATKRMTGKKVSAEHLEQILEAIQLAPTSRGLQPFKVLIIENPELKSRIRSIADNQPQVEECSHLLIFAAWSSVSKKQIDDLIAFIANERGIPVEKLDKMKSVLVRDQLPMTDEAFYLWASKQLYIALAFGMLAAASLEIDAAAMEGFSPTGLDKLLGLDKLGLRSAVLLALGYRDVENDWLLKLKKVRRPYGELFMVFDEVEILPFK